MKLDENFTGMLIAPNGEPFMVEDDLTLIQIKAPFYAEGSGADFAIGAMEMGASAEQAVQAAIKHSANCGGKIQTVKL